MLVGQTGLLALLTDLVDRARQGQGQVLVVEGEAGIGKSTILDVCIERCRRAGVTTLVGRADELGATRPFAPLLDALADGPGGDEARLVVRRLLREPTPAAGLLQTGQALQALLAEDLVGRIEELCAEGPVALCLDDLHQADSSTLAALGSLVRRTADLPLVVAMTMRPVPRRRELAALIDVLEAPALPARVARLDVAPLAPDDIATLVANSTGGRPPGPKLLILLAGCAGNPLLVVELLAWLGDAHLLADGPGGTTDLAIELDALRLPTTLTESVRRQMANLDDELQTVAAVAALLGTRFTPEDLATVTRRPPFELLPLVQTLVEARLLTDDGRTLSYRHDLVREAVAATLPQGVRAGLHRDMASALRAAGAPTVRVAEQLALGAAPGSTEAVAVLRAAAEEIARQDPTGAEHLLRRALELCAPADPHRDLIYAQLVSALAWAGRLGEAHAIAEDVLSRPLRPPRSGCDPPSAVRCCCWPGPGRPSSTSSASSSCTASRAVRSPGRWPSARSAGSSASTSTAPWGTPPKQ